MQQHAVVIVEQIFVIQLPIGRDPLARIADDLDWFGEDGVEIVQHRWAQEIFERFDLFGK